MTDAHALPDVRRRRLLFRANHRGSRENDILVGGFVSSRIAAFSEAELDVLEGVLEIPEPVIADYLTGRAAVPAGDHCAMLLAMRDAAGT